MHNPAAAGCINPAHIEAGSVPHHITDALEPSMQRFCSDFVRVTCSSVGTDIYRYIETARHTLWLEVCECYV